MNLYYSTGNYYCSLIYSNTECDKKMNIAFFLFTAFFDPDLKDSEKALS